MSDTGAARKKLWAVFPHTCHYCQRDLTWPAATADHIVPLCLGGTNAYYNLVLACGPCNVGKADNLGACTCARCTTALNRYRSTRRIGVRTNYSGVRGVRRAGRTEDDVAAKLISRMENLRIRLDEEADPLVAASMRGNVHGLQTALNLLRTIPLSPDVPQPRLGLRQFPFRDDERLSRLATMT